MSIMRCERHGRWDSDSHEYCPKCGPEDEMSDTTPTKEVIEATLVADVLRHGEASPFAGNTLALSRLYAAAHAMRDALEQCQSVLADIVRPKETAGGALASIQTIWARGIEAEAKARAAVALAKGD